MALWLKTGKQILGLSAVARSQQQQRFGVSAASKYLFTTDTKSSCLGEDNRFFSTIKKQNEKEDNNFEVPPKTLKSFFTRLFRRRYSPPPPPPFTPFQELLGKFMDLVEESKYYPEDGLPRDIRPVLKELLYRMTDESIVKFVYEFARPAASSPPIVIDRKVKALVDRLPSRVIHLFLDVMIDMIKETYIGGEFSVSLPPKSFVLTADVSYIGKEHLKLFAVDDFLMVTGTHKDAPPEPPQLLALSATIHNIINMPSCPYSPHEVTASIVEDQEKGSQLKIIVPSHDQTKELVNKPRVFQMYLHTHQG